MIVAAPSIRRVVLDRQEERELVKEELVSVRVREEEEERMEGYSVDVDVTDDKVECDISSVDALEVE